jgi:hypothetical protein
MPQGISGNDWHSRALTGELDAGVECLVAKWRAVPARKDKNRAREVSKSAPKNETTVAHESNKRRLKRLLRQMRALRRPR